MMHCKECNSKNLHLRKVGPHYELFCGECLEFHSFLDKKKVERLKAIRPDLQNL